MRQRKIPIIGFWVLIVPIVLWLGLTYFSEYTRMSRPTLPVFVAADKKIAEELRNYPLVDEWPEYTDNRFELTFKYPPGWEVAIPSSSKGKLNYDVLRISDKKESMSGVIIEQFGDELANKIQLENILKAKDFSKEDIIINGLKFKRLLITDRSDKKSVAEYYFLIEENPHIKFRLYNHYGLSHLRELELEMNIILNNIMSTMRKTR